MLYPEDFGFSVPEAITLRELFFELEKEVSEVASSDGRYLAAWQCLTPAAAIDFLMRRRRDIEERCRWYGNSVPAQYLKSAPIFLRDMCRVATFVEATLERKPFDDSMLSTTPSKKPDPQSFGTFEQKVPQWSTDIRASYDRMLSLALSARTVEPKAIAHMTKWTTETSRYIEEIRASQFADRTVYLVRDMHLPSSLETIFWRKHLAIRVPDEWMDRYSTYVTHDVPSLAVVYRQSEDPTLALELASGTIRLDATRMAAYLREFDTELPILFISNNSCALAVHRFNSLVDATNIEDFARRPESHEFLLERDALVTLPDGTTIVAEERFSVFDCLSTGRPLTADPDELEEIPF